MLSVLEPSEISALTAKKLEEFRFPLSEYPIGPKRNKEIKKLICIICIQHEAQK